MSAKLDSENRRDRYRSRGQLAGRLANLPPCLIGMEACVGAHHLSRKLTSLGHDARLMPGKDASLLERAEERLPRCAN
jgi:transposase